MVIIFTAAWFYRQNDDPSAAIIIGLESVGAALLFIAGWMGGTLVYRNQIGVDPRYADAGKWKEQYFNNVSGSIIAASLDELKINQMKLLHVNSKRIVIARTENGYVAFDDRCPHRGGSLAGGAMICGTVQCPWHGSQFDAQNGVVKAGPAKEVIKTYPLIQRDGKVFLEVF